MLIKNQNKNNYKGYHNLDYICNMKQIKQYRETQILIILYLVYWLLIQIKQGTIYKTQLITLGVFPTVKKYSDRRNLFPPVLIEVLLFQFFQDPRVGSYGNQL